MAVQVSAYAHGRGSVLSRARSAVARAQLGERSVIEVGGPPRPLLRDLLDEGVLKRALVLLERDGDHGRIVVLPRRGRGLPSLAELLEEDHRRLDDLSDQMVRNLHIDPMRAIVLAHLFSAGMRRHVTAEEAVLFPPYEAHFGASRDTTTTMMEREHRAMLHYLERLLVAAQRMLQAHEREQATSDVLRVLRGLNAVVAEHSDKEERTMFPMLDRNLSEPQRTELLRRIVLF
jgi:hemerythrin-like domain-containing protein